MNLIVIGFYFNRYPNFHYHGFDVCQLRIDDLLPSPQLQAIYSVLANGLTVDQPMDNPKDYLSQNLKPCIGQACTCQRELFSLRIFSFLSDDVVYCCLRHGSVVHLVHKNPFGFIMISIIVKPNFVDI